MSAAFEQRRLLWLVGLFFREGVLVMCVQQKLDWTSVSSDDEEDVLHGRQDCAGRDASGVPSVHVLSCDVASSELTHRAPWGKQKND